MPTPDTPQSGDGRHERSQKSRDAVVEAMLALIQETGAPPIAEEVAERAGISRRTVFRLFEDMDTLRAAAREHLQAQVRGRFPQPDLASMDEPGRIVALTDHLSSVYEFISPIRRLSERARVHNEDVDQQLRSYRTEIRRTLSKAFANSLKACDEGEREARLMGAELLCGWQTWNTLRHHQRCSIKLARRTVATGLRRLLLA